MRIEQTKRKGAICHACGKPIDLKYRAVYGSNYYHISCLQGWAEKNYKRFKEFVKEFNKPKYKKIIVLEKLK